MARNYQAKEAFHIIENRFNDPDTYVDFVRKFPGFAGAILSNDIETICKGIPFGSARQFDKSIWDVLNGAETEAPSEDDGEDEAEEEVKDEKPAKGKGKGKAKEPEVKTEDEGEGEDEDEDEGEESKYAGMSPKKLFTLCQKAGLKVKEKQPVEYYVEKLEYADKKKGTGKKAEAEDEGWDDEDEKPAKGKGKGKAKESKEDDEDDWDF